MSAPAVDSGAMAIFWLAFLDDGLVFMLSACLDTPMSAMGCNPTRNPINAHHRHRADNNAGSIHKCLTLHSFHIVRFCGLWPHARYTMGMPNFLAAASMIEFFRFSWELVSCLAAAKSRATMDSASVNRSSIRLARPSELTESSSAPVCSMRPEFSSFEKAMLFNLGT